MNALTASKRFFTLTLVLLGMAYAVESNSLNAEPKDKKKISAPQKKGAREPKAVLLSRRRTYSLEVERLDSRIGVTLVKQWVFGESFPPNLLTAIKKSPMLKKSPLDPLLGGKSKPQTDSGFIRWPAGDNGPSGLLWYVNDPSDRNWR